MSVYKKIVSNSFYLYLIQGINFVFPLLLIPYIIKIFNIDSYGLYTFAFSFVQIIGLIVDFGFHLPLVKKISQSEDKSYHIDLFWRVTKAKCIIFLVCLIFSTILLTSIDQFYKYQLAIFFAFPMVIGNVILPIWLFQGINKMKTLGILTVLSKILIVPIILIFVKKNEDLYLCIFIQSLLILLSSTFSILYLKKIYKDYFSFKKQKIKDVFDEVKASIPFFLSNSTIILYTQGLVILLGYFGTAEDVGLYGVYDKIVKTITAAVLTPVVTACFPLISRAANESIVEANRLYRKILFIFMFVILCIVFFFFLIKPVVIGKFLANYALASSYYYIFVFSLIPIAVGSFIGQLGIVAIGDNSSDRIFSNIYIYVGLLSLPISILFVSKFKLDGTILSMYFAEIMILILMIYHRNKLK